jgi:N-acetylneuraminic acid mutarotase
VTNDIPPSARERHVAVSHDNLMFIFGGYDGISRLNDFYEFNVDNNTWQEVIYSGSGLPPSPRHSTCATVYDGNMYVFSGYDGQCRSDLHRFNFETNTWGEVKKKNQSSWPKERYRTCAALYKNMMYVYGGHDGIRQLDDFWGFDIKKMIWEEIKVRPNLPSLRDSHMTFTNKDCLYIHGGSISNSNLIKTDLFEYNFSKLFN